MLAKELLNKIAKVTSEILFHNQAVDFKSEKLKDSEQEVKYSELAVGSDVSISSAAGDEVAPNGQYDTDSGVSFLVVDGKISEILSNPEPEVAEELAVEEPAKEDEKEKEEELSTEKESELESKIAELQEQLAALQAELQAEKEKESVSPSEFSGLKSDVIALTELLAAIGKTPAEFSKTDERAEAQDSKNDRLKTLAGIISKK